ncbi:MAG: trypsin-like serine protease [Chloroflexi bacterium]|nr:MAG: trypsin-like serine protease [Chloroflexota bacterium]HKC89762.1 trypsin-like peptidase domain-containing protein [Candidatus Limnocylindria bacterium]
MPTRADRPYGSFPRGHHEVAPDPGVQAAPERTRIRTTLRRALPWTAALAGPALLVAISMAPAPRAEDIQPSPTPRPSVSEVYAKVAPSVVQVKALRSDGTVLSSGSGVVIDEAGDILTSLHVVQDAGRLSVVFADGTESAAVIISELAASDIAALRPANTPAQLTPATLGNPSSVRIGDDALVVGNPFNLTRSLSTGVVSGLDRSVQVPNQDRSLSGLIQFDAAVNPGSSGGPLVNRDGEVVGIVTGLVNPTGQPAFSGVGFAVTIATAAGALGVPPD